ncbi:hypothetical protein EJ05DRAFT_457618 [Pseudovirgaria hyperparasitica]|uniref:E3 ubiquitin-protein ligase n=1 Tax=Pseudovirgaria hyperparasitica TaxID=470096 RepID=A0A6A6VU07_9PEZI|nr:uncharacterized protein EJ05DRAFT_457618 [Pseudovirgaria hyperparasitica]KAF2753703.1 hypothetical protein EJ05DRAFT_457618 [Pseudovirgaria hyperparasitica]
MLVSQHEQVLCRQLRDFPRRFHNRYNDDSSSALLELFFRSLTGFKDEYLPYFFPNGVPRSTQEQWSLKLAQGAVEGAEYTEAARGHPCGHIFKSGEATYRCKTCTVDETCVICTRCFDASDHEGHTVYVSISPGNAGCCDCGDDEAWIRPVHCNIHTIGAESISHAAGKIKEGSPLPEDLQEYIRTTISKIFDYFCDVFSCSPEQLRLAKTEESIRQDEHSSRLHSKWYGELDTDEDDQEYALVLWNDEKHTIGDVENQVARACKQRKDFGRQKANEVNYVGRSVVIFDTNIPKLLKMAKIIEEIKLTVTIRSARDTFREQMCGTIIEWISDIAGCSVGPDHQILRNILCEEMLKAWRVGSEAHHSRIGTDGLDDHEVEDYQEDLLFSRLLDMRNRGARATAPGPDADLEDANDNEDDADNEWEEELDQDEMDIEFAPARDVDGDVEMDTSDVPDDELEASEATIAGYPPPPPPPPPPAVRRHDALTTPGDSEGEPMVVSSSHVGETLDIPKTPKIRQKKRPPRALRHWLEVPEGYKKKKGAVPIHEDLWERVRLDWMILYDLRMWKKARVDLRDVFISTVVTIPYFKRVLGLRFAGLYTTLAQLYLIADREPDHSIINLSLQMLTTPSITAEVVDRGNFLTNLMAILYTFLTSRQVGYPQEVNPMATLAFQEGAVTNRRMYHFFLDMKYLLGSDLIKERLREEPRYLLQFLDLVKLHQGICPNLRAVGEHIEYENDQWISASLITREINRLCRHFSEAFVWSIDGNNSSIYRAIRDTAKLVIIHSTASERKRFQAAEIKKPIQFKTLSKFEFEYSPSDPLKVVEFVVSKEAMSFHHALHYTLSWMIDRGKSMSRDQLVSLLSFSASQLKEPPVPLRAQIPELDADDYLLCLFDFPLRVCAWLAQMRANTWIRNGVTLRHQMSTYRGVVQRDVAFQRDIFLLQVGLVICPKTRFLASIVDRFGLSNWIRGSYSDVQSFEEQQQLDIVEDFVHLLIILLSERTSLLPIEEEPGSHLISIRRDIAHILCFKPLPHSDLSARLPDKTQDLDEFPGVLREMTTFRPPEGVSDTGTFMLKEQYFEDIDPYIAQYSRNQREEAEALYKKHMAKKTGQSPSDIVYEPKLRPIRQGIFKDIAGFTRVPLFIQIIYYLLNYALESSKHHPSIPATRVEAYLQFILQLVLVAIPDEENARNEGLDGMQCSFAYNLIRCQSRQGRLVIGLLHSLSEMDEFKTCEPKIKTIMRRLQHREPKAFAEALKVIDVSAERMDTSSPAPSTEDKELKKKQALERQARVMASFKEQQTNFMANQAFEWGDDEDDYSDLEAELATPMPEEEKLWKYPSGTCILCQEETSDQRLYGTFAFITDSHILRQTDIRDSDWVTEAFETPTSLDRSADQIRPFGVSGKNRKMVTKVTFDGRETITERQDLGKGFPAKMTKPGPISHGCGHIMHYHCFEVYVQATQRRHANQIARAHPERPDSKEFLCPLCKALGNAFLPIIWKGKSESYPAVLKQNRSATFENWLATDVALHVAKIDKSPEHSPSNAQTLARLRQIFVDFGTQHLIQPLASKLPEINRLSLLTLPPITAAGQIPSTLPRIASPPHFAATAALDDTGNQATINPEASNGPQLQPIPILELVRIYQRLRDTMKVNNLSSRYVYNPSPLAAREDLIYTDTLSKCLGFTISATEIAQRGVEAEVGTTLLDRISPQTLTHIRILSETVTSYMAIGSLRNQGLSNTCQEFLDTRTRQFQQLFNGHPRMSTIIPSLEYDLKPFESILSQDTFIFFTECATCVVPALQLDIQHVMRICYIAELVRVVISFFRVHGSASTMPKVSELKRSDQTQERNMRIFIRSIIITAKSTPGRDSIEAHHEQESILEGDIPMNQVDLYFLHKAMLAYALPFLRKAVILMHARYGVDFPNTGLSQTTMTEHQRLTLALKLPSLDEIFETFASSSEGGSVLRSMVRGWISHLMWSHSNTHLSPDTIMLSHPAIFELVGLPKNYDTLTDEAIRRRCPTTGRDLTDPAVCLFCGEIFCSQGVCCMQDKQGGCALHQKKCGGNVGMYINIRKGMVLFMNQIRGCWVPAPYLDIYGETDPTLRRHHQLFLNQKRYDALLRSVWLGHGIQTMIARRLDAEVNNGGWETL